MSPRSAKLGDAPPAPLRERLAEAVATPSAAGVMAGLARVGATTLRRIASGEVEPDDDLVERIEHALAEVRRGPEHGAPAAAGAQPTGSTGTSVSSVSCCLMRRADGRFDVRVQVLGAASVSVPLSPDQAIALAGELHFYAWLAKHPGMAPDLAPRAVPA